MTLISTQLERLLQNAKLARSDEFLEIVEQHRDLFNRHRFRLRPSVGSISLVSCANATPQLGFSKIRTARHLQNKLDELREGRATLGDPGRPTPEKKLQSWLISEAMQNDWRIGSIERALNDHHSYWFVSDEIALKQTEGGRAEKLVADLLLVREDGLGESEFVNVELKYQRTTETHKQAEEFRQVFRGPEEVAVWRNFAETVLGGKRRRWKGTAKCRGLVIWPSASDRAAPRESTIHLVDAYRAQGIDTLCYSGPEYILHAERSSP